MAKQNSVPTRIDLSLFKALEEAKIMRIKNGLATINDMKMPKITKLLMKTNGMKIALEELKIKPERIR